MDNDDLPVGRVLSRREAMKLVTIGGMAAFAGLERAAAQSPGPAGAVPACVVRPEMVEGPYFIDHHLRRSDIRTEPSTKVIRPGVPLALAFSVSRLGAGRCSPLAGAIVDLWHCDASGVYSGVSDPSFGNTEGQKFLRGLQTTDRNGRAAFLTIFPGWYAGRAVHLHFKVRTTAAPAGAYEFTSQLFFDEGLIDVVHAQAPYAAKGRRDTANKADQFYPSGGPQLMLAPAKTAQGYAATFDIGLDLSDAAVGRRDTEGGRGAGVPRSLR
jgi:protocatechuate 3,4-dioxygenase beta subunit